MDEEDSQDELINKNASHGKGKRPASSILSDEEENSDDGCDSQEGATDSEEDDEDDDDASVDRDDEDGEEEDGEDSGHEDAEKDLEGAVGSTSTDLAGLSSDEDAEKCPICLNSFHEQPVATPESCMHYFCLDCILEWAKNANSCPVDRIVFSNILLRKCFGGKVQKTIMVQKTVKAGQEEQVDLDLEQTSCEVCGGSDREDRLLLCDGCDAGYHMECLTPPLDAVPVEEWFCPECAPNNHNTRRERSSEDESSILPTTSRSWLPTSRPTRAIARTQHSERVRANINRHRITQARTAAQIAPRYLMQSTWLDETINAVVAGLNTAVYVRDLTPRPRPRRRRRTVKRRKTKKEGKATGGKTASTGVKRRKRRVRRTKSRKKLVQKMKTTTRGRIARSLGIKKPVRSSSIPSVYRPSEQTLGSMRADIGAASLSIYGDPFDLDPFDDESEETQQAPTPSSLLEAKRRGLSRSALRSHQPVARPISAGLPSRRGQGIPQVQEVAEAAPVPDLLGSILSGQSMLLMDSSDVIINRDGSLKATKPVSLSLPRTSISGSSASEETRSTPSTEASPFKSARQPASSSLSPSAPPLQRRSSHSSPLPCPAPMTPVSPSSPTSLTPSPVLGQSRLHTPVPHRPVPSHPAGTEQSQWGTCAFRGQTPTRIQSGASDARCGVRGDAPQQPPAKKPPPKPVWLDVSGLPRIPKIKRESSSAVHGSSGSNGNNLPASSMTSLAGDKGREHTVDQQRASVSQSRAVDSQRHRLHSAGPSSSFSNSFSAPSSSASVTSNSRPSSSSAISFRISTSGNPWHARRLSAPEQALPVKDESAKKAQKDKQKLLTSHSQAKKPSVKSEIYDPFNPTGSDSSESEAEIDCPEMEPRSSVSMQPAVEQTEGPVHQIKAEPMDMDSPVEEEHSEMFVQVKNEPAPFKEDPWSLPSDQLASGHMQMQSGSLSAVMAYSESPAMSDSESSGTPESPFTKALGRSRSSSTSSHHSDNKVKMEVKAEPEDEPSPVQPKCKSEPDVPKGNGLCEVPSLASSSDVSSKSKQQEISPCPKPEEEGRQSESASQSPNSKELERCNKKNKHSRSEERRHSPSRSPCRRQSRSRSKEKRRSRSRSKEKRRSRSRSKERRRSRSRSKERRRSRSRSKERRRSRSRSKERKRSRSRSKERKRSRSRSKERRRSRSRSKERRQSRSRSKEKRRSRSRSKEKRRSRSRSKEKRRSRSRSRERRHSHLRDRRRSTRSSSNESSRKRKAKRDSHERYDGRLKDGHKRSKDKKRSRSHSQSRSRSRSRERRREQTSSHRSSSASRDGGEARPKRKRSRSTSRDRKRRADVPESSHQKERSTNKSTISTSVEATVPNHSLIKNALALKGKKDSGGNECETRISVVSVKVQSEPSSPGYSTLIEGSKNPEEITKETPLISVSNKPYEVKPKEIKQETIWPLDEVREPQLQIDIKEEREESYELCQELKNPEEIKIEDMTTTTEKSEEFSEISLSNASTPRNQTGYSLPQDEKSTNDTFDSSIQVKIEQIWPDDDDDDDGGGDDPYSDNALIINLCPADPAPMVCKKEPDGESPSLPVVAKEEMEVEPLQAPCLVKQEPVDSSDEDINVDYLIDNLDFIKKEMKEGSVTDPAGAVEPQTDLQEVSTESKQEMESSLVVAGTKAKSQGKRVTWNIQEPEGPQPEKMSKLALFKLKLKQEGSRKAASTSFTYDSSQESATVQVGAKPTVTSLNPPAQGGRSNSGQRGSKSHKEELLQDPQQKDKYMKKLHMQERAIEEVKLAIKPFYQKRDITKEEYKEILRKAVQKVCHSKSGEINPVKVANLVKAYVDKYKHARKHHKSGSSGQSQSVEDLKDSETPG
ncbi:PHD and RING finger domain-containing protein 1 isoform X1 [Pygocentrus nattereri]|uniref:PHD and ring finger domains 1 n=1 Tax=Pygocentrus nattereri TaxID=42514 RepID=A0A3B4C905_PYGNA|nr:PHD and RING finger domain-containing protein 1 isoform X1 [Pygocentrus nattereri]XP_017578006.2 PHD and RING finger domain-containing protein 1 isoform X1 [Pygocentrus nattereri]